MSQPGTAEEPRRGRSLWVWLVSGWVRGRPQSGRVPWPRSSISTICSMGMWGWTWSAWIASTSTPMFPPAGGRAGGPVPHRASGQPDSLAGAVPADRGALPPRGRPVRRVQPHPAATPQAAGPHPLGRPQAGPRAPYLERATRPGVVAIVAAQEFQQVFVGVDCSTKPGVACFDFPRSTGGSASTPSSLSWTPTSAPASSSCAATSRLRASSG
jgi:hypothetical protein